MAYKKNTKKMPESGNRNDYVVVDETKLFEVSGMVML